MFPQGCHRFVAENSGKKAQSTIEEFHNVRPRNFIDGKRKPGPNYFNVFFDLARRYCLLLNSTKRLIKSNSNVNFVCANNNCSLGITLNTARLNTLTAYGLQLLFYGLQLGFHANLVLGCHISVTPLFKIYLSVMYASFFLYYGVCTNTAGLLRASLRAFYNNIETFSYIVRR